MALPNFLIVGAVKCGTTSLYQYLNQHPDVFMSERKEPNFFTGPTHGNRVTEAEYHALFEPGASHKARGEASVAYLYDPVSPEAIHRTLGPDTRIVISIRNPVDAAYSLWGHMVRAGGEKLPFQEALAAEPARLEDEAFRKSKVGWLYSFAYADRARFAPQVERYLTRFGPDRVKVYVFEEFFRAPREHFADLCRFLGIDDAFVPEFRVYNPTGPVLSTTLRDLLHEYRPWKAPFKLLLPVRARKWIRTRVYWLNRRDDVKLPALAPEVRAQVWALFEADVARLEQLLGRNLRDVWLRAGADARAETAGAVSSVSQP